MLVRGVVNDQIDDNTDAPRLRPLGPFHNVPKGPIARDDPVIVLYIMHVVTVWRWLERHEPERSHTQTRQVIETAHEPLEVSHPILVGIHERCDVQTVENGIFVPEVIDH